MANSPETSRSHFQLFKAKSQSLVRTAVQPGILQGVGLVAAEVKQALAVIALAEARKAERGDLIPQLIVEEREKPYNQLAIPNFLAGIGLFVLGAARQVRQTQ